MLISFLLLAVVLMIFMLVFVFVVISEIVASFYTDAPFVSVTKSVEEEVVKNLLLDESSVFFDLGCGDGRVLEKVAEKYPNTKIVGVEIAFLPYVLAKWRTRKYKNVSIRRENIFKTDISNATHFFLYLYPHVVNKLFEKIKKECKRGTIILSCDFEIENITPLKVIDFETKHTRGKKLFLYHN